MGSPAPIVVVGVDLRDRCVGGLPGVDDGAAFDRRNRRRNTNDDPGFVETGYTDAFQQDADHLLRHLKVGDRTFSQGPHGHDVARRSTDHVPRLATHGQHILGAAIDRDNRWLVENDPLVTGINQRVGRAQIDC